MTVASPAPSRSGLRIVAWIAAGAATALVLSVTASYAPPIAKRLALFHAVFGVACGYVLAWLMAEIKPPRGRWLPACGAVLCLLGAVNMAWLSYRQLYDARQKAAAEHPQDQAALAMLEKLAADDPETRRRYEEERRYSAPGFSDYLAYRVSSLGVWPPPWPELFWGGELLLAGGLCAWVLARSRTACSTIPGESVMVK